MSANEQVESPEVIKGQFVVTLIHNYAPGLDAIELLQLGYDEESGVPPDHMIWINGIPHGKYGLGAVLNVGISE